MIGARGGVGGMLLASAEATPDAVLVHHLSANRTYERVAADAGAVADWLAEIGLRRGDRVVLALPNGPDYLVCYFGVLLAGCVVVAVNPAASPDELTFVLRHSQASAFCAATGTALDAAAPDLRGILLVGRPGQSDVARDGVATVGLGDLPSGGCGPARAGFSDDGSLAQIIYTSGTTGRPKGVMLTHANLLANTRSIISYLELTRDDSVLVILPFFYSYGNSLLLTHVAAGGRLVVARDFVFFNEVLDLAERSQVTGFAGVPASYSMLLHRSDLANRSLPALRYATCAGGALPQALVGQLRSALPHVRLFVMYGQTEASARLASLLPSELDTKPGSVGRPIPGVEITIRDESGSVVPCGQVGELVASGPNIMRGFWRDPEATAEALRPEGLHTRDLGWMDEEGYLWIVGRADDVIKSGAYRIGPEELEQVLAAAPGVHEAAVVGEPDEFLGEVPVGFVVPRERSGLNIDEVARYAGKHLPRYKQIRRFIVADSLPRTSTGKVRRGVLRAQLREPQSRASTGPGTAVVASPERS